MDSGLVASRLKQSCYTLVKFTMLQTIEAIDRIRQQLLADGTDANEADRILQTLRVLWSSYDSLTSQQRMVLDQAGLDQDRFFDHRAPK